MMFTNDQFDRMPEGSFMAAKDAAVMPAGRSVIRMTPLASRMAAERGVDLNTVKGSGFSGKIFSHDLNNVIQMPQPFRQAEQAEQAEETAPAPPVIPLMQAQPESLPQPAIYAQPESLPQPAVYAQPESLMQTAPVEEAFPPPLPPEFGAIFRQEPAAAKEAMVAAVIASDEDIAGVIRMSDSRRDTAIRTAKSSAQTAAVTQHVETDITELLALCGKLNANREPGEIIPLKAFFIKAMALSVREKERFRLRLAEAQDAYLLIGGSNIGFQVDTNDGVATPVIKDADIKPLDEIAAEISFLSEKARRSGLPDETSNGSAVTLVDKGESDVLSFTPIINQPEAAILGIGSVYKKLVMTERSIENRRFVIQSLTFDHRIVNGSEADEFQRLLKTLLEDPGSLVE